MVMVRSSLQMTMLSSIITGRPLQGISPYRGRTGRTPMPLTLARISDHNPVGCHCPALIRQAGQFYWFVDIASPSLPVILTLNTVKGKNLTMLRVNSAKSLRDSSSSQCSGTPQNDITDTLVLSFGF